MDKQSNLSFALRAKYFDHQGLPTVACVTTVLVSWLLTFFFLITKFYKSYSTAITILMLHNIVNTKETMYTFILTVYM